MKKNRIRGRLKGIFFVSGLHRLIPYRFLTFAGHLGALSAWISRNRSTPYSDFYSGKFDYSKRYALYEHLVMTENLDSEIDYLEFGVAGGHSFRWWTQHVKTPGSRFFGFDTFTGLPEDWGSFKKGDMSNGNEPPSIDDNRCSFYQGLFQQTLPAFLKSYRRGKRLVIHMDADLYSSTLFVLTSLSPFLNSDDIIIFDEFNVPMHEFKAFSEWVSAYYIRYNTLAASNNFYQLAVKLA
ncbi:MAG: class I SAM-dependent methyltransferase [Bacteroidales bacterium]